MMRWMKLTKLFLIALALAKTPGLCASSNAGCQVDSSVDIEYTTKQGEIRTYSGQSGGKVCAKPGTTIEILGTNISGIVSCAQTQYCWITSPDQIACYNSPQGGPTVFIMSPGC